MKYCSIFIPCKDKKEARKIAKALLDDRLVACANILPEMESLFLWKGKREASSEVLLILKTKRSCLKKLTELVTGLHSYECPVVEVLEIREGNKTFLDWLDGETCL